MSNKIKRAALYIRVSHAEQALNGFSLEAQATALDNYVSQHDDIEIVGVYRDEGITARKPISRRPALLSLTESVKRGEIDLILITRLDRFFRNVKEYYKLADILDRYNVAWRTVQEDYNTDTVDGRLKVNIMLSIAEAEADIDSARVKAVLDDKRAKGQYVGGKNLFGYRPVVGDDGKKYFGVDEEKAAIIRDLYDKMLTYRNRAEVARYIESKYGIRCEPKKAGRWLRNKAYTGRYRDMTDYYPRIISDEVFYKVQDILESRAAYKKCHHTYIFAGLLVCPLCGNILGGIWSHTCNYPESYRCAKSRDWLPKEKRCKYKYQIRTETLEPQVLAMLHTELDKYELEVRVEKQRRVDADSSKEIEKKEAQLKRLNNAYIMGNLDEDEYTKSTAELRRSIALLKVVDTPYDADSKLERIKELRSFDFDGLYHQLTLENKQAFWRSFVDKIYIDTNRKVTKITFL